MAGTIFLAEDNPPEVDSCLNGVRPRWPEQSEVEPRGWRTAGSLNGVRPRWPEQSAASITGTGQFIASQWSPA